MPETLSLTPNLTDTFNAYFFSVSTLFKNFAFYGIIGLVGFSIVYGIYYLIRK